MYSVFDPYIVYGFTELEDYDNVEVSSEFIDENDIRKFATNVIKGHGAKWVYGRICHFNNGVITLEDSDKEEVDKAFKAATKNGRFKFKECSFHLCILGNIESCSDIYYPGHDDFLDSEISEEVNDEINDEVNDEVNVVGEINEDQENLDPGNL